MAATERKRKMKTHKTRTHIIKFIAMLALMGILFAMFTVTAHASEEPGNTAAASSATQQTVTREIELTTRSALLVDKSGSIKNTDAVNDYLAKLDISRYDFVGYFDDKQLSVNPNYKGGGDSYICERIDDLIVRGYTHIDVLTDGQQCSPAGYSALSGYTDVDITIYLVEEAAEAEELIDKIFYKNADGLFFKNSQVKVDQEATESMGKVVKNPSLLLVIGAAAFITGLSAFLYNKAKNHEEHKSSFHRLSTIA